MKTKIKYTLTFLFGAIYFWALKTMISPTFSEIDAFAAFISGVIFTGGTIYIIYQVSVFFYELWNMKED